MSEQINLKIQASQVAAVVLAVWGLVSTFGRLIDNRGPDFVWEIFSGMWGFDKVLFIPIPGFLRNFLFDIRFQGFSIIFLVTLALVGTALSYLATKDNKFLVMIFGLAGLHIFGKLQNFVTWMFDSEVREWFGVFTIFRWTIFGIIIPLLGSLVLGAVLFGDKVPAIRAFFERTPPLNIPDISFSGLQAKQGFTPQSFSTNFNSGDTMTNDNNQAGANETGSNPGATAGSNFGGNNFGSPWDLTTPLFRVQMMGTDDRLFSIGELQQMAKQKALKGNTLVQHRDAGYPVQASTVPNVFSDKQWITTLLLSFFLGSLGIDRFYLGHTGLGIGKLLTFGGCGVWSLIDFILIAMRNVTDSEGRPMA